MSVQIALLESTNDIIKLDSGGIARVSDGRYTIQLCRNKLLTLLGEWKLDPTIGWLNFDDFEKDIDLFDIEMRAKKVILSVQGVKSIDSFNLDLNDRQLTVYFKASTTYGEIDLTVPWSG